jgi:hypothetical protein
MRRRKNRVAGCAGFPTSIGVVRHFKISRSFGYEGSGGAIPQIFGFDELEVKSCCDWRKEGCFAGKLSKIRSALTTQFLARSFDLQSWWKSTTPHPINTRTFNVRSTTLGEP